MWLAAVLESPATKDRGAVLLGLGATATFALVLVIAWLSRHGHLSGPVARAIGITVALVAGLLGVVAGVAGAGVVAWVWVAGSAATVWLLTLRRQG